MDVASLAGTGLSGRSSSKGLTGAGPGVSLRVARDADACSGYAAVCEAVEPRLKRNACPGGPDFLCNAIPPSPVW